MSAFSCWDSSRVVTEIYLCIYSWAYRTLFLLRHVLVSHHRGRDVSEVFKQQIEAGRGFKTSLCEPFDRPPSQTNIDTGWSRVVGFCGGWVFVSGEWRRGGHQRDGAWWRFWRGRRRQTETVWTWTDRGAVWEIQGGLGGSIPPPINPWDTLKSSKDTFKGDRPMWMGWGWPERSCMDGCSERWHKVVVIVGVTQR